MQCATFGEPVGPRKRGSPQGFAPRMVGGYCEGVGWVLRGYGEGIARVLGGYCEGVGCGFLFGM